MENCPENIPQIYVTYQASIWDNYNWFAILFSLLCNALFIIGLFGNILCIRVLNKEKRKSFLVKQEPNNLNGAIGYSKCLYKAWTNRRAKEEQISELIYWVIAFANTVLLGIFYLFELIAFAEKIYFPKVVEMIYKNRLDQYLRWTNEILFNLMEQTQSFILMNFLLLVAELYVSVFEPFGKPSLFSSLVVVKRFIVIVGILISLILLPKIIFILLEMIFLNPTLYSVNSDLQNQESINELNGYEKKNVKAIIDFPQPEDKFANMSVSNWNCTNSDDYMSWFFFIHDVTFEVFFNTVPFVLYDKLKFITINIINISNNSILRIDYGKEFENY